MQHCPDCGAPTEQRVPEGDERSRAVCTACGAIHYSNPRVVTGCVLTRAGRILLCLRDIEPRAGFWTVPAGFLEDGETMAEGAAREAREEALARCGPLELFATVDVPQVRQVHVMFRGELLDDAWGAGAETRSAELVAPQDLPWDELAFGSVRYTLERYLEDLAAGSFSVHTTVIRPR